MQNSEETKIFRFSNYKITYLATMKVKTYEESYCYGIIFFVGNSIIELFHNSQINMDRIFIHEKANYNPQALSYWCAKDIPFKPATFVFLPKGVIAEEI